MNRMNEEELKKLEFNEYIQLFNEGKMIYETTRLKESYTVKLFRNLLLIKEVLSLCITYEEDYCKEHPKYYCTRIDLNDILTLIETKLNKKAIYIKNFNREDMCSIINDYVFLLK